MLRLERTGYITLICMILGLFAYAFVAAWTGRADPWVDASYGEPARDGDYFKRLNGEL